MTKEGERDYLNRIGEAGLRHAAGKPFSDPNCWGYLARMSSLMALLPPPPATLLDLGCGTGWTSCFFALRGYDVTGIDISADMVACAEESGRRNGLENLSFRVVDYETAEPVGLFDCAVFFDSLHHSEDTAAALAYVFRSLRDGGVCLTSEPGKGHAETQEARNAVRDYGVTEKDMPPARIIRNARRAGFRHARVYPDAGLLNTAAFRDPEKGLLRILFRFSLVRGLAASYVTTLYKRNQGTVLLRK